MKKLLHLTLSTAIIIALCCSCSEKSEFISSESRNLISIDEAIASLNETLSLLNGCTKSGGTFTTEIKNVQDVFHSDLAGAYNTKAENNASTDNTPLAYIVNFQDNNGYAILSADKRMPDPVIALVETGNMSAANLSGLHTKASDPNSRDSLISSLISNYLLVYSGGDDDDNDHGESGEGGGDTGGGNYWITDSVFLPVVNLLWGQRDSLNYYCESTQEGRKPLGCIPVAVGMTMAYNRYPSNLIFNGHTISWNNINSVYYVNNGDFNFGTWENCLEAAFFLKHIGEASGTLYFNNFSFTVPQLACDFLQDIGYSNASISLGYSEPLIMGMVRQGKPAILVGFSGPLGGHAWIVDGAMRQHSVEGPRYMFHCNWGWFGECNGYYASQLFQVWRGPVYTDPNLDELMSYDLDNYDYDFDSGFRVLTY